RSTTTDVLVLVPDLSLTANPNSVSFVVNDSATATISLHSIGGFSGNVSLNATSSPAGLSMSCSPAILVGSQSSICTVNSTTISSYTVTITGTSGNLSHNASIDVTVTPVPQPDFSLSADPSALSFVAGESGSSTISVMATGGFSDTVGLTATSDPAGVTTVCSPTSIPGSGTAACVMNGRTPGQFKVEVTGTSGSLTRSAPILVNVLPGEPMPDTIPPQITITFPSNSTVLLYANVTVKGHASDDEGIQTVELSTDNVTWVRTNGTASWTANLTIGPGTTTIYARATDT